MPSKRHAVRAGIAQPVYVDMKSAMVAEWRRLFGDPEMPFYFVQLAAVLKPNDDPAFGSNPAGANLYNRAGLPAAPFQAGE